MPHPVTRQVFFGSASFLEDASFQTVFAGHFPNSHQKMSPIHHITNTDANKKNNHALTLSFNLE